MKVITNEDFHTAWIQDNNIDIIEKVASKYAKSIHCNDLQRCKLIGLWQAMRTFNTKFGAKFTTHLANCVKWECLRIINENIHNNKPIFTIAESGVQEEIIPDLDEESQTLLKQRFIEKRTLREIGTINNCSHETIRRKITKIVDFLKIDV